MHMAADYECVPSPVEMGGKILNYCPWILHLR